MERVRSQWCESSDRRPGGENRAVGLRLMWARGLGAVEEKSVSRL